MRVSPTPDAIRLRALAAEMAGHLSHGGRRAVAITGSVARGDAGPGSDLDLWVLGPHSDRQNLVVAKVPVTLLRQRPREALTLDTLCLYEVSDILVLADARGAFRAVQRAAARRRKEVRAAVLDATWDGLRTDLRLLPAVSDWQRTLALRQLAFRLAATWLYVRTGWRVPRLRAMRRHLPRPLYRQLEGILGLPSTAAHAKATVKALGPALRAGHRVVRRVLADEPPRELSTRLQAHDWDEALLLARRFLRREVLPAVLSKVARRDVAELQSVPGLAPLLHAVRLGEHLGARPQDGSARRLADRVARLTCDFGLAPLLPADVRRALGVTARGRLRAT